MNKKDNYYFSVKISTYELEDLELQSCLYDELVKNPKTITEKRIKFEKWICDCVADYSKEFYNFDSVTIEAGWANLQPTGVELPIHTNGGQLIANYYIYADETNPPLRVYDCRPPNFYNAYKKIHQDGSTSGSNSSIVDIPVKTGMLLFMPAYLLHSVPVNLGKTTRVCWSMNLNVKRSYTVHNKKYEKKL